MRRARPATGALLLAGAVLAGAVVAGAVLAGCSSGASPTTTTTSLLPTTTAPEPAPVVYTFGVVGSSGKLLQLDHRVPVRVAGIPGRVVEVATSNSDTYALTSTGAVWAWGADGFGELGDGLSELASARPVRVQFPAGVTITSLPNPTPYDAGLAVDTKGDAWGWGLDADHDLCLPGAGPILRPVRLPLGDVTLATGAGVHSLFDSKGTVYGCGSNSDGELGDGSTVNSPGPTPVAGLPHVAVKTLVSAWKDSGALLADGDYYDWGFNRSGQLGDGTRHDSDVPVPVRLPGRVVQVSQGGSSKANGQTLVLLADGALWDWGSGTSGQLGDGGVSSSSVPQAVLLPGGVRFRLVASGGSACYGIDTAGKLWAWGQNDLGQLGLRGAADRLRPVTVGIDADEVSSTATNVAVLGRP